tara:strand:+ start:243 stop:674 length:432 start_codon:yes stop_codon:yes gene_type:complete
MPVKIQPVYCFDLNGKFLKKYNSVREAAELLEVSVRLINNSVYRYHIVKCKYYFNRNKKINILDMRLKNNPYYADNYSSYLRAKMLREKLRRDKTKNETVLGHKDTWYLTIAEMELGYVAPEYNDLSKDEKQIWNELEKEKVA